MVAHLERLMKIITNENGVPLRWYTLYIFESHKATKTESSAAGVNKSIKNHALEWMDTINCSFPGQSCVSVVDSWSVRGGFSWAQIGSWWFLVGSRFITAYLVVALKFSLVSFYLISFGFMIRETKREYWKEMGWEATLSKFPFWYGLHSCFGELLILFKELLIAYSDLEIA